MLTVARRIVEAENMYKMANGKVRPYLLSGKDVHGSTGIYGM